MPLIVRCPNPTCGTTCSVTEADAGRAVKCAKCGKSFALRPTLDGQKADTNKGRPSAKTDLFPTLPAEFGRYRVLRLLGKGGMGAVYLAEDSQLGRQVALKIPFFDAAESAQKAERFVREARSAAVLQHPNICTVFDAGQIDGRLFITMAYIEGKTLADEIDPDAPMPQRRAAEIVRKIARALEHAHGKGTVHRDLKPANVMMTADGEPVVMDFGLAKRIADAEKDEAKLTRLGGVLGTPSYMSPEQVRGDDAIGPGTDVYSLGVMLFEMLTGKTPYAGSMGVVMGQILHAPVPPVREFRADVDARLNAVCRKAMAKEVGARFRSMGEFADALGEYANVSVVAPPPASTQSPPSTLAVEYSRFDDVEDDALTDPAPRGRKRGRWTRTAVLAGVAAVLLALAALGASVVFEVKTKEGILVVEVDEPNPEVYVDGHRLAVTWDKGGKNAEIRLKPGTRKVEVKKDGFAVFGEEVTLEDGKRRILVAKLNEVKPPSQPLGKEMPTSSLAPDRKAAEYVLSIGGTVRVNDEERDIKAVTDLPPETFRLTYVDLRGNLKVTNAGLACFKGCPNLTVLWLEFTKVSAAGLVHFKDCKRLKDLSLRGSNVSDLSPLKDMSLKSKLDCSIVPLSDLSPLKGMPLTILICCDMEVSDLSPLKEMPLTFLWCHGTKVTNLSPLKGMPLLELRCDFVPERDTTILRSIETLEKINGKPAKEFWKEVDAGRAKSKK